MEAGWTGMLRGYFKSTLELGPCGLHTMVHFILHFMDGWIRGLQWVSERLLRSGKGLVALHRSIQVVCLSWRYTVSNKADILHPLSGCDFCDGDHPRASASVSIDQDP